MVQRLDEEITLHEERAAVEAWPDFATPAADVLVKSLSKAGVRIAVTTNNSPSAAAVYLRLAGLAEYFGDHIYGRTGDPRLMKPHPDCLNRALDQLRAVPDDAVLIGDTVTDLHAAREAKVGFVGYARNGRKAALLRAAGADPVVRDLASLSDLIEAHSS